MINETRFALALAAAIVCVGVAAAQPARPGGNRGAAAAVVDPDPAAKRALDKLKLTGSAKDKAQDALDAHNRVTRKQLERARLDFLNQVKEAVSEKEFLQFKDDVTSTAGRKVSAKDLVEHVLSYDKSKLGKVGKNDLPERMQHLVEKGDVNKDGYLDRNELTILAFKTGQAGRGPGRAFTPAEAERALNRLQLTGMPKDKASLAVSAYKEASRKVTDERRADLIVRMKAVLSEEQHRQFSDSLKTSMGS